MIKAGVIGWPVSHSLSPKLHNFWLQKYQIDGEYKSYPVKPEELEKFIRTMADNGFAGCNVTLPHKERVFELLQDIGEVDEIANHAGAVNTIVVENKKLLGTNTDVYGFAENIRSRITGKNKAVVLGAGGAARAVIHALIQEGFDEIFFTNRNPQRARLLFDDFGKRISSSPWDQRWHILKDIDLLVNTTSFGALDNEPLAIGLADLPKNALVTDIVYNPLITPLLQKAQAQGNPIVDGLGMLLHQAVPGFAAWFGKTPEVTRELRDYMISGL